MEKVKLRVLEKLKSSKTNLTLTLMELFRIGALLTFLVGLAMCIGSAIGRFDATVRDYAGVMALGISVYLYSRYTDRITRQEAGYEQI